MRAGDNGTKIADIAKIVPEELQEAYEWENCRYCKNLRLSDLSIAKPLSG